MPVYKDIRYSLERSKRKTGSIYVERDGSVLHPNHTPESWREIEKLMPDYLERKAWLKANGARMDL